MVCQLNDSLISPEEVAALLRYDPESGRLRWLDGRKDALSSGSAGCLDKRGYVRIRIRRVDFMAHRVAWALHTGAWPSGSIDHINGIRADNRIANLRDVSHKTNCQNRRTSSRPGRLLGAHFNAYSGRWTANIGVDYKYKNLGYFDTEQEAHEAYVAAKRRLHDGCTI